MTDESTLNFHFLTSYPGTKYDNQVQKLYNYVKNCNQVKNQHLGKNYNPRFKNRILVSNYKPKFPVSRIHTQFKGFTPSLKDSHLGSKIHT
jgi:hypothetical protein